MKKSKILRTLALMLTVIMAVSFFSACGGDEYEEIVSFIDVSGDDDDKVTTVGDTSSDATSSSNPSSNTGSAASSNKNTGSTTSNSGSVNPADYRGTTVVYATWDRSEGIDTSRAIANFKKKYGINVTIQTVAQKGYVQSITGLIASGKQPDIIKDCGFWPTFLTIAQPLQNAKMDLTDPIYDQDKIKQSTINGKTYSVSSLGPIFNYVKCCFYNKKLLQQNGIKTPEDYKKIGKWDFAAVDKIARETVALGSQYSGFYSDSFGYCLAQNFGYDFFTYNNGKVSTINYSDPTYLKIAQQISIWNHDGLMAPAREKFSEGKCALAFTGSYGCLKTGYWYKMSSMWKDIGIIEMPSFEGKTPVSPTEWNGYGICEGAKNPIAAGMFLRYYLDCNNYDLKNEFISDIALDYVTKHTSENHEGAILLNSGAYEALGYDSTNRYYWKLMAEDPKQVQTLIKSLEPVLNNDVKNLNSYIDKQVSEKK